MEQYKDKIIILNQENKGVTAARNLGLERATGDYILFVDADDYIDAEMLYKVLLEANDFDIISFSYSIDFLDDKGELRNYQICNSPFYSYRETSDIYNTLFASQIGIGEKDLVRWARGGRLKENKLKGFTWCYLIKRSIVEKNSIRFRTNIIYNEDAIFNIEVFEYAKTAAFTNYVVYHYEKREGVGASYLIARNPKEMAYNKLALLHAKEEIYFKELKKEKDIISLFCASNIFSLVEMSDLCSQFSGGYNVLKEYIDSESVKRSIREIKLSHQRVIFKIMLFIYKIHAEWLLYLIMKLLNKFNINFREISLKRIK